MKFFVYGLATLALATPSTLAFILQQRQTSPSRGNTILFSPEYESKLCIKHSEINGERPTKKKRQIYKHLFRHFGDISFDSWLRCLEPEAFLKSVGYTTQEIERLEREYPTILSLNVHDQLAPKVRFLVETLQGGNGRLTWNEQENEFAVQDHEECDVSEDQEQEANAFHSMRLFDSTKDVVDAAFFGCQLDRIVGPYHAYLETNGLPHGRELLENPVLFKAFLKACNSKSPAAFVALCQEWSNGLGYHTMESVETFSREFTPGLIPAAKGLAYGGKKGLVPLLLNHGANPLEYDKNGVIPLFWAAGSGDLDAFKMLLQSISVEHEYGESVFDALDSEREPKDGATALHWACCGINEDYVGTGGSFDICLWILEKAGEDREKVCNLKTWNSNTTPLMWAAWAGNVAIVDLLVVHGAKLDHVDNHGQNALHWAAAAGHENVVDFIIHTKDGERMLSHKDDSGCTPFDYAKLFDRQQVVDCLQEAKFDSHVPASLTEELKS